MIKKEVYYNYCLESLLNKTMEFISFNEIKFSELEMKGQRWQGRLVETPNIKEILYNKSAERANGKITKPFVILHELGHYFDKELEERNEIGIINVIQLERNADKFIYIFCIANLCVFEQFILQSFIENFSKIKISFSEEQKKLIEKEYNKVRGGNNGKANCYCDFGEGGVHR